MAGQTTCWTIIDAAADGGPDERQQFALQYEPLVRAYLGARWKNSALRQEVSDACQDFFVYCFRENGSLERVERGREGGFRAYLYSTARIIARRWEEQSARQQVRPSSTELNLGDIESDDTRLSQIFDRAWAEIVVKEAVQRHKESAERSGSEGVRRVELLNLRFCEGLPIRKIATLWDVDAAQLHREYAKARDEFSQALFDVVQFHHPTATTGEIHRECVQLLAMLS
jgi:RNA polymerase sigma factor (sigma-70 family)